MIRFTKLAGALAAISVIVFPSVALATGSGQIEQGDIYRVKDVTTNSAFADNITAACGDMVAFRVRVHNGGPATLTNVKVAATLNGASSTSHGSQVSLSADNNLHNMTVTANAGVNTSAATTASYVNGSTELLNYGGSVIKNLSDGVLGNGVNIGSLGPLTSDTVEVQFEAKLSCESQPPAPVTYTATATATATASASANATANCAAGDTTSTASASASAEASATASATATSSVSQADAQQKAQAEAQQKAQSEAQANAQAQAQANAQAAASAKCTPVKPVVKAATTAKALPNTGPGDVLGIFTGASSLGAVGHYIVNRRRRH